MQLLLCNTHTHAHVLTHTSNDDFLKATFVTPSWFSFPINDLTNPPFHRS